MGTAGHVHLDRNAGGPIHPAAWQAYVDALAVNAAPESLHPAGRAAQATLLQARRTIAAAINAAADDVVLLSGGTEADALALAVAMAPGGPVGCPHVVCSGIEHAGVYASLAAWAEAGRLTYTQVPAGRDGQVAVPALLRAITPETRLVSLSLACNETGVVQPVAELADHCRPRGIRVHSDAVQAIGRIVVDVQRLGVDLLSLSGHKVGAMGGTGALYVHPALSTQPLVAGPAEANVPGAASLAAALGHLPDAPTRVAVAQQRDAFEHWAQTALSCSVEVLGQQAPRLPNTSCMRFIGCAAEALMMALDVAGFAVSTGSACSSGAIDPSPLLLGMGLTASEAQEALRLSWGGPLSAAAFGALRQALAAAVAQVAYP
jgi:cysteine desulfurase